MNSRWKATLPKELPLPGMSHYVLSFKTDAGDRVEFTGQAMTEDLFSALRGLQDAVISVKTSDKKEAGL